VLFNFAFKLDQDKDTTIRQKKPEMICAKPEYISMVHVIVLPIFNAH
jgi:hypothetical protein